MGNWDILDFLEWREGESRGLEDKISEKIFLKIRSTKISSVTKMARLKGIEFQKIFKD